MSGFNTACGGTSCQGWNSAAKRFKEMPTGVLGLYTCCERLARGLRRRMCGSRKFSLEHISRDDLACLTHMAADISGIPFVTDADKAQVEGIFSG